MRCKREECLNLLPKVNSKEYEKLLQEEWGDKGYCSKSCMKTDEDHLICDNCKSLMIYNSQNNQYVCPKCDNKHNEIKSDWKEVKRN